MASVLNKDKNEIRIINWYWYVINCRKSKNGGKSHTIHPYATSNNKYLKKYDKKKNDHILIIYKDANNL